MLYGRVAQQVLQRGHVPVLLLQPTPAGREQPFHCRRVMVPFDGSATAEVALPAASTLSTAFGAEMVFVLVVPTLETMAGEWLKAAGADGEASGTFLRCRRCAARRAGFVLRRSCRCRQPDSPGQAAQPAAGLASHKAGGEGDRRCAGAGPAKPLGGGA